MKGDPPLIRVGMAYQFDAPNAGKSWYILKDIKQTKAGIELVCKGKEAHDRIFTKDQISAWQKPKGIIAEDYEEFAKIGNLTLYTATIIWWPYTERRGRKPGSTLSAKAMEDAA